MTKRLDSLSSAIRIRVMKRDRFQCTYCGVPGTDAELEIDHIIAVANGGSHHMSNLTTACRACNQKKGTGTLSAKQKAVGREGLVGMFLHTLNEDGCINWQGHIIAIDGDIALVQLFSWIDGSPTNVEPIPKSLIYSDKCQLYATCDLMNHEAEYGRLAERGRERDRRLFPHLFPT